jgi:cathepsin A (carboxypeptidase C)
MPAVKKALHVDVSPNDWAICSIAVSQGYNRNMSYLASDIYSELQRSYRVLIYHGDTDMACDYIQGQAAINTVAEAEKLKVSYRWVPWTLSDEEGSQTAGWLQQYAKPNGEFDGLALLTVKGAGHMAPQWKPQASFEFFSRFLNHQDLRTGQRAQENFIVL